MNLALLMVALGKKDYDAAVDVRQVTLAALASPACTLAMSLSTLMYMHSSYEFWYFVGYAYCVSVLKLDDSNTGHSVYALCVARVRPIFAASMRQHKSCCRYPCPG